MWALVSSAHSHMITLRAMASAKEYKFLAELDDEFKCLICLGVARDPLQHEECGKLFCKDCLEKYGKKKPCPNCRQENSQYYVDKRGKRTIEALRVKCHNANRKCPWEGTVGTVEAHVATCEFTLVPCPNEECKATIERGLVGDHVERECDYTVVPCKYRSFGCNVERKRRDMATHEHDNKQCHLDMAMDATLGMMKDIMKLKSESEKLRSEVTRLSSAVNVLQFPSFSQIFTLKDYEKAKKTPQYVKFPSFYLKQRSYRVSLWVYAEGHGGGKGTHISVYITIVKGDYDADLKWPLLGKVTFTLLNQVEDWNHYTRSFTLTAKLNAHVGDINGCEGWGQPEFISNTALDFDPVKNTQYLKDNTLYFKMNVELNE